MNTSPPRVTLLETVHGSHLYGLANANSDLDTYRVVSNDETAFAPGHKKPARVKTRQKLSGNDDVLVTSLTDFMVKCEEGTPQALEAMFSLLATGPLAEFKHDYYLNTPRFAVTYRRTVLNFARLGVEDERAQDYLAPTNEDELLKKRVRESLRSDKPKRVERNGMLKYRRHSLRLMLNLATGVEFGQFNPTLSDAEKDFVLRGGDLPDVQFATLVKSSVDFL